ncbi:MAG TPA: pilin [Candidatus Saccharimonadales bacterium]
MHWIYYCFAQLVVPLPDVGAQPSRLQDMLNIVLAIMGAVAVLIIVLAGFRYITSQGNPNEVTTAKNAILYALIGLVVIMFAFAIVNFVLEGLG